MSDIRSVYLDNNATTRMFPEVLEAMLPYFNESYGNPSSGHHFGRSVKAAIAEARDLIAAAINAEPAEVYFTSGGTEADNIAIKGYAWANRKPHGGRIVTSTIEHPAVLAACKYLSKSGFEATYVDVDEKAMVDPAAVAAAMHNDTLLVSVMAANNEVGSIQPIREITEIAHKKGAVMHTDGVQAFLKSDLDVKEMGVDMMALSGHKVNGPKGIGVLYLKKGTKIDPLSHGGHHERGMRAGTENVAGIIGLAKAVEIGLREKEKTIAHVAQLRDDLEKRILATIPYVRVNGSTESRLPGATNISFECVEGESLLINLDMVGIAISTGSACSSGSLDPSHVLMAMGIPHEIIHGSLRFSFGHENSAGDVDYVMERLPQVIAMVRRISPLWDSANERPISLEEASQGAEGYGDW